MAEIVDVVVNNTELDRYEIVRDEGVAVLEYRRRGKRMVLVHTGVPKALEGNGIGGKLLAAAVADARTEELTVVPLCPYARSWIEKHPNAVDGVDVDFTGT
ncbi:MAG TPA: GNAT family N-acetyltransferase [Acidimicrobiales bacterium]